MNRFALLLDRLSYEPGRNNKLRIMTDYFRTTPDPERGFALAALTGTLSFQHAKPNLIRTLIASRVDPYLFGLSYDYVGDLSETVALLWPNPPPRADGIGHNAPPLHLSDVVGALSTSGKLDLPKLIAGWLDALDENGRWALLKLITGALRIGVSARLAKTAVADLGGLAANEIEEVWHGLRAPYIDLFAWVEGREGKPDATDPAPFHPAMLAHAIEDRDFAILQPADFIAEWKWDGIRVQATRGGRKRWHPRRAALFAHRRGNVRDVSRPDRNADEPAARSFFHSTANCWWCATGSSSPSAFCNSGSTAGPFR